jgi:hypothetical protein
MIATGDAPLYQLEQEAQAFFLTLDQSTFQN